MSTPAKRGDIIFYREPDLAPGVYTMEAIVFDAVAQRGSARVSTLTVPAVDRRAFGDQQPGRRESQRGESDAPPPSPLRGRRSTSAARCSIRISASRSEVAATELPFYFTLYGNVADANASAELLRNGSRSPKRRCSCPPPPAACPARRPAADWCLAAGNLRAADPRDRRPAGGVTDRVLYA